MTDCTHNPRRELGVLPQASANDYIFAGESPKANAYRRVWESCWNKVPVATFEVFRRPRSARPFYPRRSRRMAGK